MSETNNRSLETEQRTAGQTEIYGSSLTGTGVYEAVNPDATSTLISDEANAADRVGVYERPERTGPSLTLILALLVLLIVAAFILLQLIR